MLSSFPVKIPERIMPALISDPNEVRQTARIQTSRRGRNRSTVPSVGLAHTLTVMKSSLHGSGCFAIIRFLKNSPIAEYAGERITRAQAMRRMRAPGVKRICELDADCYIDGSVEGNATQYINHSCEPNADVSIIDEFMIVFALRDILPGDEITVEYLNSFGEDHSVCHCRTPSCRQRSDQQA